MKTFTLILVTAGALALAGCSGLNRTEQRILSGGALGAAGGAGIAALTGGSVVAGGLIGSAAGAVGGYLVDRGTFQ